LKFSTPPLNCGYQSGMKAGPTSNYKQSRITRDSERAAGP
jgi:hypothetical protein